MPKITDALHKPKKPIKQHTTKQVHIISAAWQMLKVTKILFTHRRLFSAVNFVPRKLRKKTLDLLISSLTVAKF